jgi:hypothetical protein
MKKRCQGYAPLWMRWGMFATKISGLRPLNAFNEWGFVQNARNVLIAWL